MQQPGYDTRTINIRVSYEAFVVSLVALSLVNSLLFFLIQDPEQRGVILIVQILICAFLLVDAFYRLIRAPSKRRFVSHAYNWLYFVGSLPIPFIYVLRLVPVAITVRHLRHAEYEALGRVAIHRRAQNTLLSVIFLTILVLEFGSVMVLGAELDASGGNIKTAGDALWWAIVTVATVGYGDHYPITVRGRIIGVVVMVVGVAIFTSLSSFLAQWFLRQRPVAENGAAASVPVATDIEADSPSVEDAVGPVTWNQLRALMDAREAAHQREVQELRARLAAFESAGGTSQQLPPGEDAGPEKAGDG